MRVLITGARGLLGSACVREFRKHHEVVTADGVDLRNRADVYWVFNKLRPEGVIHCAAKVGGVKANRDQPVSFIEDNLAINSNVLAMAHLSGVKKLVNIGTSCLYPRNAELPVKESSLMTGPFEPDVSAYATAKLVAYESCKAYRKEFGSDFITVCPANLYGTGDNYGPSAHVLPALIHKAFTAKKNGGKLEVWGDGTAVREFLFADDAASAILACFDKWSSPELVNIGSGVGTTIRQLAETIADYADGLEIEWLTSEPTGIQKKTFDTSRIRSLGWQPTTSLEDGISITCQDYLLNAERRMK